jgi:paraquat-inducible protein A
VHRYELISCHDCGTLHRKRALRVRERARCTRCEAILYRGTSNDGHGRVNRMIAITLGALLTYFIAQFFPIVELEINGLTSSATMAGAIRVLWAEHMEAVACMVFLFTILFPLVEIGSLLYVTFGLSAGRQVPGFHRLLRAVQASRKWGMIEVLMIGILITLFKMTSLARVVPQPGVFAFGALTVLLAIVVCIEPRALWQLGDQVAPGTPPAVPVPVMHYRRHVPRPLPGTHPLAQQYVAVHARDGGHLLTCDACGLVNTAAASGGKRPKRQQCSRCGSTLHARHPNSIKLTWALLIAALILYIPANMLPVMYTRTLFGTEDDTILSGVALFWNSGSKFLAVIIFIASIAVPVLKLASLALLTATAQSASRWRPRQRTSLYRLVEFVGRWSMLDIFVVTLTVALVRFQTVAVITAGPGALAFGAVVVLTMLASMRFDPRLIWDPVVHELTTRGTEQSKPSASKPSSSVSSGEKYV